jgi:hypothetical protein
MSTDGTHYFQLDQTAAGVSSYAATGLSPDAAYFFEVQAEGLAGAASPASTSVSCALGYVAPTLSVTPEAPATEEQGYVLDLSANYPANVASADLIDHWLVDWGRSDITEPQVYSGSSVVAQTPWDMPYPAGTASAAVVVTAVDGQGRTFTVFNQTVPIAPVAAGNLSVSFAADSRSATITWSSGSQIASQFDVQRSAWAMVGQVPAVSGQSNYSYSDTTITPGPNGSSDGDMYRVAAAAADGTLAVSSAGESAIYPHGPTSITGTIYATGSTIYEAPGVSGSWSPPAFTPDVNHPELLDQVEFASGESTTLTVSGLPAHMLYTLDLYVQCTGGWQNGDVVTLNGPHGLHEVYTVGDPDQPPQGSATSPEGTVVDNGLDSSASFTITVDIPGDDGNGNPRKWILEAQLSVGNMSVDIGNTGVSATGESQLTNGRYYANGPQVQTVAVGGEDYWPVSVYNGYFVAREAKLTISGWNSNIIQPLSTTVTTDDNGIAFIPVKAVGVGTSPLIVRDDIGDQGTGPVSTALPHVSSSGGVTEGASYDPASQPKFTFDIFPSRDSVDLHYDLLAGTATGEDYSGLPEDTVTIPAGQTELDVPITAPEINQISADRSIVVTLAAWPAGPPGYERAAMVIHSIDTPTVTIGGQADNVSAIRKHGWGRRPT